MGYLFGNILLVSPGYVALVAVLDLVIVGAVALLFRRLRAMTFDEEFSWVIGVPVGALFLLLLTLVALTVVVLIRVAGVILVIALLTIPAAVARHWTDRLSRMMVLSVLTGGIVDRRRAVPHVRVVFLLRDRSSDGTVDYPAWRHVVRTVRRRTFPLRSNASFLIEG